MRAKFPTSASRRLLGPSPHLCSEAAWRSGAAERQQIEEVGRWTSPCRERSSLRRQLCPLLDPAYYSCSGQSQGENGWKGQGQGQSRCLISTSVSNTAVSTSAFLPWPLPGQFRSRLGIGIERDREKTPCPQRVGPKAPPPGPRPVRRGPFFSFYSPLFPLFIAKNGKAQPERQERGL